MAHRRSEQRARVVELLAAELQGPGVVFCPNPKMPLWSNHPRVFIDVAATGDGQVPVLRHRVPAEGRREGPLRGTERAALDRLPAAAIDRRRSLVVAPQWIGDAVMAEPLLRRPGPRGERLTVAALPWVAPVFRAMPQVDEIIELPFAHGRLDWAGAARASRPRCAAASTPPTCCRTRSSRRCCRGSAGIPRARRLPRRGPLAAAQRAAAEPGGTRPPMVAFYGALAGDDFDAGAAGRGCGSTAGASHGCARRALGLDRRRLLGLRARRRVRPGQALAGRRTTRRWRARCTPPTAPIVALLGSAGEARALRRDRRAGPRRLPGARRHDVAARRDRADRRRRAASSATTRA